jgi:predicted glutamine amidotransferase
MCVIAISRAGAAQPSTETLKAMYQNNPDGAGYMVARKGKVEIHKGFMTLNDWIRNIENERFTINDPVVYHCRISTQAGVNPWMTHPFPLTRDIAKTKLLDLTCSCGVAHNGIIRMTSDHTNKEYSDTALFISDYMAKIVKSRRDMTDPGMLKILKILTDSKLAIMDGQSGEIATVGDFVEDGGVLYSNTSYKPRTWDYGKFSYTKAGLYGKAYSDWYADAYDDADFDARDYKLKSWKMTKKNVLA